MESKILGYFVSGAGLLVLALSFFRDKVLKFLPASIDKNDILITGVVAVVIGVILIYSKNSSHHVTQAAEEVPIYQGQGKHRKIVGYQKSEKK